MANVGMVILKGFEVVDLKKQLQAIQGLLNHGGHDGITH
jgi:hypothetical protein